MPIHVAKLIDFTIVKPGNESIIAAGTWCPGKNELETLRYVRYCLLLLGSSSLACPPFTELGMLLTPFHRTNIKRDPTRLRQIISAADFVQYFGEAKPHPEGERQNIFGMEGELKTAPKGVSKDHKYVMDFQPQRRF